MAQENRWSPYEFDLEQDREQLQSLDDETARDVVIQLRDEVDGFFLGDRNVAEDLTPLSLTFDEIMPQLYVSSQLLDEAVHTVWFERYWDEVIRPEGDRLGVEGTDELSGLDDIEGEPLYEILTRTERAMDRLLDDPSPENVASAMIHYHLTAEGLLGLVSLHRVDKVFTSTDAMQLDGWLSGFEYVRADEARHVEFGTKKVRDLYEAGDVSGEFIQGEYEELHRIVLESFGREVHQEHGLGYEGIPLTEDGLLDKVENNYYNILDRVGV